MAAPAILDADMATLARWGRSGLAWWLEELHALVPAPVKARLQGRPLLEARFDGRDIALTRRGVAVPRADAPVAMILPAGAALVRSVPLPVLGRGDLRRLLAIEAERLLPFAAGTALVAHEAGAARGDGQQIVDVAGLPLAAAEAAMAAADRAGLQVHQLRVADAGGAPRFDFLPGWARDSAAAGQGPRRFWWSAVGVALVVNLGVLIGRDIVDLRETEALVASHATTATLARALRARVIGEDAARRALVQRRGAQDPLPVLAALTRALPDAVWLQRLAWDGRQLRIAGYKPGSVDAVAALRRTPGFVGVRSTAGDVPAQVAAAQPFEVTADYVGAPR